MPEPSTQPKDDGSELARQRQLITELIHKELRANPLRYENKAAPDMQKLFRQMLIEKLTAADAAPSVNKVVKAGKAPAKKAQLKFRVVEPQAELEEDEDEDDEGEEE